MVLALSKMLSRRAVITGLGAVTPLASDAENSWQRMVAGDSAITKVKEPWIDRCAAKIGAFVPTEGQYALNVGDFIDVRDTRRMAKFTIYAMVAAEQALRDAGLVSDGVVHDLLDTQRVGMSIGVGIGGFDDIEASVIRNYKGERLSPMFLPSVLGNLACGNIAIRYKFNGPSIDTCAACASGLQAIAVAARSIIIGEADIMVAGGTESAMCEVAYAGFHACKALSTSFNHDPTASSRPWSKDRDGFVMGEGSGVVVVEEYEHARRRNANIYGEIVGIGTRTDVYHVTAPDPTGIGAYNAMYDALMGAEMHADNVDYIKAHATSTPAGDSAELLAVHRLFKDRTKTLHMSAMKSSIGHALGGSGGIETVLALLALRDGIAPPTLNLDDPIDVPAGIDLVPKQSKKVKMSAIMSNAFGFGGTNVSMIVRAV